MNKLRVDSSDQARRATKASSLASNKQTQFNELLFSSSSNNSNFLFKSTDNSSVDLPDETNSSGSSLSFSQYNRLSSALTKINRKNNKKIQHLQCIDDRSTESEITNSMTISDLDTRGSNQPEIKIQRKKFIKCILREDVHALKNAYEQNKFDLMTIKDKHKNTLMHIACGFGRLKSVQTLMKICPKMIDRLDDKGHSPIDVAIKHGQLEVIKWLLAKTDRLQKDSQMNKIYDNNIKAKSCLHLAAKHGENEIIRYILNEMHKLQLSMDIQDTNGNAACHLAAKYGHLDCLQTLVEFNCDITIVNKNGHTPCFMAEYHGNNECVHYLMIVETCINLSIKVVRLSRKLREAKSSNEVLKGQMDEAISINNDFINQRENVMNISLDLMQRQINDLETKISSEIEKFNSENRNLKEKLDILNSQLKSFTSSNDKLIEMNNNCNSLNCKNMLIQPNIESVRQDFINTKQICSKVILMDQKKLDSIKTRFDEMKSKLDSSSSSSSSDIMKSKCSTIINSCDYTDIIETREHFDILRKMYQETTHKLMIFRNALKEHNKSDHQQRPKTANGTRTLNEMDFNSKSSSSSSSLNSAKNMIDMRQIKSSTPTLIRTNPNFFSNSNNRVNSNIENYIEYSSNDETLSENENDDRLNHDPNENIIEEDEDEILVNFENRSPKINYAKSSDTYLLNQSDNEDDPDSDEQPSIQTVIENQNLNNFANNDYANDQFSQQLKPQQHFIIEEIEEKFEEQYEEHEELEEQEQKMINTFSKYQSDIRNKMNLKQN